MTGTLKSMYHEYDWDGGHEIVETVDPNTTIEAWENQHLDEIEARWRVHDPTPSNLAGLIHHRDGAPTIETTKQPSWTAGKWERQHLLEIQQSFVNYPPTH